MIVISDTSPITTLEQIGRVNLLRELYREVLIPEAVRDELYALHQSLPAFFKCLPVSNQKAVESLLDSIDAGEAEAIVLAQEQQADLLLIDELAARKVAARQGTHFIGLLGVLAQAKFMGLIPSVREMLQEIESKTTFFISQEMKTLALKLAGEL